jgi:hypothetical protein
MKHTQWLGSLLAAALLCVPAAQAANVNVNCAKKKQTISAAIAKLPAVGTHNITVRGACHEAVVISERADLTIHGVDGASIHDPTPGESEEATQVVLIRKSPRVRLEGLSIHGGASGVTCLEGSNCHLDALVVTGATRDAVVVGGSLAWIDRTVIENNGGGLSVRDSANVSFGSGSVIRGSGAHGVVVGANSILVADGEITGNAGHGVWIEPGAELHLAGAARIANNGEHGLFVDTGSASVGHGVRITGNGLDGVHVGSLAHARFNWASVTGNLSGMDVNCAEASATTINAEDRSGGGRTNCRDAP